MDESPKDSRFSLWLEFELEHWQRDGFDPEDDFFNMKVTLASGKIYAMTAWTFKFLETAIRAVRFEDQAEQEKHVPLDMCVQDPVERQYLLPPDFFVSRLDRNLIEQIVSHMLDQWHGQLLPEWECSPLSELRGLEKDQ